MVLWSQNHVYTLLPAMIVMVIVAAVLRHTLGTKPLRIRMIPFRVLTVLILLLEIGKQAVSFSRGYDLYAIPLHFCSLALFTMPAMAFYNGKGASTVRAITSGVCASIFLLTAVYPELIYSGACVERYFVEFMDFHTVTFHNIVMFAFLLIPALDLHETPSRNDPKAVALFILGYCAVSAPVAQILKVNYNNFYSCNVPPLEALRISLQGVLGVGVTQLLYILIVVVLDILFAVLCYWLYRLLRRLAWPKSIAAYKKA